MDNLALQKWLTLFSDNPYYQAAIIVLVGLLLAKILNNIVSRILIRIANKTASQLDNRLLQLARPALFYSVLLVSLGLAGNRILEGSALGFLYSLLETFAVFIWANFGVRFARIILRSMSQNAHRFSVVSSQTLPLFENLVLLLVIGLATYFIFTSWHIDMTAWLASAGIVGIAVGFAAKDTLANLFSGVFILADAPYKIGDFIVLESGERGEITHIGIRSTRLLTRDDVEVTIPNAIMGNSKIINESGGPHKKFRIRLKVGVAYGSDVELVRDILQQIAEAEEAVCIEPAPRVRFRNFGNSSLDFELLAWVDEPVLRGSVLDRLHFAVYHQFMERNIEIPYNKQDVYIKEMPKAK